METPAVEILGITKQFPGILANDNIDFSAARGALHAIVGENGAGKSTLMGILYGLQRPDSGEIRLFGETVQIAGPRSAISLGIGMVHQHLMLIPAFTALENIILGEEPVRLGRTDYRTAEKRVLEICERFGLRVDLKARVSDLSVSAQQKVEILKALYRRARILILDEPSAVLTPQETDGLFVMLKSMACEGMTVILISHKLREVMENAHRITVLRQGKSVASMDTSSTTPAELTHLMVGDAPSDTAAEDRPQVSERTALSIRDLTVAGDKGLTAVDSLTLDIHSGEILGVAGVDGNGQRELVEALVGLRRAYGSITLDGAEIARLSVRRRLDLGIAYIPEDRQRDGLVQSYPFEDNSILGFHHNAPFARYGVLDYKGIRRHASELAQRFDVRGARLGMPVRYLSGGNQQKLVLGRALCRRPKLLIAWQPTRGLDVNAVAEIHHRLLEERAAGAAIFLVSHDLDEILALSDRVMVMFRGRSAGVLHRDQADLRTIGALMLGAEA